MPTERMTIREAAYTVLKKAKRPLRAKDIADRMRKEGLYTKKGNTPERTVSYELNKNIKPNERFQFIKESRGLFAVRDFRCGTKKIPNKNRGISRGSKPVATTTLLTFTDSAEKVLTKFGRGEPMHYKGITHKALDLGWLVTEGKTPEATMNAQIGIENRRREIRGEQPRFVLHGRDYAKGSGYVSLSQKSEVDRLIKEHNDNVRAELRQCILAMDPREFESLISRLLSKMGFIDVKETSHSNDGGIDIEGTLGVVDDDVKIKMAVQVKRWKRNVQVREIRDVRGSLGAHQQGLIITTRGFSSGAKKEATRADATPISLIDGDLLATLLMEHGIGATWSERRLFEFDENSLHTEE